MRKDSLGDRMKQYEGVSKLFLMRRNPVIIRLDMKAGHTFTRGFKKPFDRLFMDCMQYTCVELCKQIQGCKLGYVQSDEISLLLTDYDDIKTSAWFDNNLEKIVSISSSLATLYFNKKFAELVYDEDIGNEYEAFTETQHKYIATLYKSLNRGAVFDSRAFSIPKEEVCNYFIWRQQDATRNSIQMLAQANFSHSALQSLSCNQLQDKLMLEKGVNWNDLEVDEKRGICCVKTKNYKTFDMQSEPIVVCRASWELDRETPIFTQDRQYIESLV